MLKLADDWKHVLKRAWSVRFSALSGLATTILIAWPTAMNDIWNALPDALKSFVPVRVALVIPLGLTVAAIWARTVIQHKMNNRGE